MLDIDNLRLYNENEQLKQAYCQVHSSEKGCLLEKNAQLRKPINSLQRSNVSPYNCIHFFLLIDVFYSNNHRVITISMQQISNQKLRSLKMMSNFTNFVPSSRSQTTLLFKIYSLLDHSFKDGLFSSKNSLSCESFN